MKKQIVLSRMWLSILTAGTVALFGLLFTRLFTKGDPQKYLLDRAAAWARNAARMAGAKVKISGLEKIPTNAPVLYVANHQGALDIPILMGHLPGSPGFLAKQELFKIPVLSYWMRKIGCMPVDRKSPRTALKQLKQAAEGVRAGRRLVLFPEGTRSRDPEGRMIPFKRGSLKLAVDADAVLVPITVEGSRFLLSPGAPAGYNGEVKVIVDDPIAVADLDRDALKALPETVYEIIDHTRDAHHMGALPEGKVAL